MLPPVTLALNFQLFCFARPPLGDVWDASEGVYQRNIPCGELGLQSGHFPEQPFLSFSTFHNWVVFPLVSLKRFSLEFCNQPWLISCHYLMCWAICYSDTLYSIPGRCMECDLGALRSRAWRAQTRESWVGDQFFLKDPFHTHTVRQRTGRVLRGLCSFHGKWFHQYNLERVIPIPVFQNFKVIWDPEVLNSITFFECFWPLKLSQARWFIDRVLLVSNKSL